MTDVINLPAPLVPADVDLRDFPFTPMFRSRLFGSSFHARTSDAGWRAGVTLWLKSWDQVPAGTLPDDDVDLCRLAELGRDLKSWRKIKVEALWGWKKCSDGRLHHEVVAEGVMEAWTGKLKRQWGTDCARVKKANQRNGTDLHVPTFDEWLSLRQNRNVPGDKAEMSPGTPPHCPEENGSNRKGERKGQLKEDAVDVGAGERDTIREALESIGAWDNPNCHISGARVLEWVRKGADLDLVIIPTLQAVTAKKRAREGPNWLPNTMSYFDQAIADAVATRTKPMPEGKHNGAGNRGHSRGPGVGESAHEALFAGAAAVASRYRGSGSDQ